MKLKLEAWLWVGRLAAFAGLFIAFGVGLGFVATSLAGFTEAEAAAFHWWNVLPVVVAALAATWVLTVGIDGQPLSTLGLYGGGRCLRDVGVGTLAGFAIIGAVTLALAVPGWVSWGAPAIEPIVAGAVVTLLLPAAAFTEELLFRGYPFRVLYIRFGPVPAVVATSVAFGLMHGANPGVTPLALVNLGLAGLLLGVAYRRSGSLWFVTGVHFGWNLAMAVTGLAVSGLEVPVSVRLGATVSGPPLWTGGDFGPEGGLVVTFVTVLGTVWLWRVAGPRGRSGPEGSTPTGSPGTAGSSDARA